MKLWLDKHGREITNEESGHLAIALSVLPASVVMSLQLKHDGEDFSEQVYAAMYRLGYAHIDIVGNVVYAEFQCNSDSSDLTEKQRDWLKFMETKGTRIVLN